MKKKDDIAGDIAAQNLVAQKDAFDVLKLFLSILVVAIHTCPFQEKIFPYVRIAVPMFFILSSYLLFGKVAEDEGGGTDIIKSYVKRNLRLYVFWFVLLLPITLSKQQYFLKGDLFLYEILRFLRDLFLGETWMTSWYIMASVIGVVLVYVGGRYIGNWFLILVSIVCYAISCLTSNYFFVLEKASGMGEAYLHMETYIGKPYNNFVIAIVWLTVGKLLAESQKKRNQKQRNQKYPASGILAGLFVILLLLLVGEHFFVQFRVGAVWHTDVYLMLLPISIVLFLLMDQSRMHVRNAVYFRRMSTIIYCSHWAIKAVIKMGFDFLNISDEQNVLLFVLTVICACIGSVIILSLAKKWKIFRYAY